MKPFHLRTKALAVVCALTVSAMIVSGSLVAAALESRAHIALKLADPNEPPSRVTMAPAAKAAMPAVVKISASKVVKTPTGFSGQSDPFRQFFGGDEGFGGNGGFQPMPRSHREGGLGSGVVVSSDGYILTNNHVVDSATDVLVTLPDRREFKAKVVGTDPRTDIAVLKIAASNLPVITVGNSAKMQIGDAVLAIGNP